MPPQAELPTPGFGLYVHVPFCASRCDFCAFYEEQPSREQVKTYLATLAAELAKAPPAPLAAPDTSVFIGGGTPTLLLAEDLAEVCRLVRGYLGGQPGEWTVEMAPSTVKTDKLAALREGGVTRASVGVQSFQQSWLDRLGRRQSVAQAEVALGRIREAGFPSVNLDLMFALPGQTEADWQLDLELALEHQPDHLSTYCLTPEEDTVLWAKMAAGKHRRDEAQETDLYRFTWDWLAEHGYAQYEVSNFARPGHRCQHNLNTWAMGSWLGIGPSAASQFPTRPCPSNGPPVSWVTRAQNPADLTRWATSVAERDAGQFPSPGHEGTQPLTPHLLALDALIFGLRQNDGLRLDTLQVRFPSFPWNALPGLIEPWQREGLACWHPASHGLALTTEGRLRVDAIGLDLLSAFDPATDR